MNSLLKYDIILQWRQGFWLIYFIVCLVYLAILFGVPPENREFLSILFVLSDTSVLGVTFVGALILLENQQNVLQSLFITPLHVNQYLLSKTISLGLIAAIMSLMLLSIPNTIDMELGVRMLVVITTSAIFTLLGIGLGTRAETLNQYFINILGGSMIIMLPAVPFLLWKQFSWLVIFPLNAAIEVMFPEQFIKSTGRIIWDVLILLCWCYIAFVYARHQMKRNILTRARQR